MVAVAHILQRAGCLALGAWLLAGAGMAQPQLPPEAAPRVERIGGLSHNSVTALLEDRQGFLWIGTPDGLNRFDGYDVVVYRHAPPDATSLSNNSVKAVLEDRAGQLWVGTDRGLNRFDRRAGRFVRYELHPDRAGSHRRAIFQLLEDHAGHLWVGTQSGLYRYDRAADRFQAYRHEPTNPHSLVSDDVWSLYEDREHTLWVGVNGHGPVLHRYDPDADHFVRFALPPTWSHATVHYGDAAGRLWLSSLQESGAFEPPHGRLTKLPVVPADQGVNVVLEDRGGLCWIGTDEGLYRYDPAAGTHLHLRMDDSPGAYLSNNVQTLYEDRAGALWIGTLSGLFRLDPHAKPFHHLRHDRTDPASLSSNTVMAVREDRDGLLWVGTLGGGLNRVDRRTNTVVRYRYRPDDPAGLCSDLIWSLYEDRTGALWIGTDEGVCVLDRRTGRWTRPLLPLETAPSIQPPVNAIREDRTGRIWLASNVGLYRFDPASGRVTEHPTPTEAPRSASPDFYLQSLYVDRAGFLWIGGFGGVLYRLDPTAGTYTHYPLLFPEGNALVSEGIWAIHEDPTGTLWLGSDQGLTRLDPQTGDVEHVTQQDGLPGSIVYAILEDEEHRLWLSTNHGLARVDDRPPAGSIRVYDAGDGLQNTEFNRRAAVKGADGTFFFGGLNGLTWFHPAAIRDNPIVPPVVITRIETANRDTTVTVHPHGLEELVLSYRDYTVAFAFAALNYTNPSQNRYRYRLEGFDEGWIEAGTRRFAQYTNIPPGTYVFRVTGSNNDGVWNEQGAALALTVTPPFWRMWWFRLLVAAAVAGGLTAAYRYRVARLLEVERMRLRIAGDLHDDIGSNLSSIALLSDMVQGRAYLSDRERRQLSKISHSARSMVEALRDIVWSIDPKADGADDLVRRMKDTAPPLLGDTPWTWHGTVRPIAGQLDMEVRRHLFLIYKEVLHNIARHAHATEVSISLDDADGTLTLTIEDNGVGFDVAATPSGTGLANVRDRAAQIGAALDVQSTPGRGTRVQVAVPLGQPMLRMRRWVKRRKRVMRRPGGPSYAGDE